jgi:hypothetical protein
MSGKLNFPLKADGNVILNRTGLFIYFVETITLGKTAAELGIGKLNFGLHSV